MAHTSLDGLNAFLAVAQYRGFSNAAAHLGVTPAAVSKAVKLMEQRYKVVLFRRTTRSVALTEAGAALFVRLRSAATEIDEAFAALGAYRDTPIGTLRLTVPRALGALVVQPLIAQFRLACPDVTIDLSLDDGAVDLIANGFDAGIRLGQQVAQDMVAVRLTPDLHWSVVGSPAYFAQAGRPLKPEDLVAHETIRYRFLTSGAVHRWEFVRGKRTFTVDTRGGLIVNDTRLIAQFAREGLGLAYMADMEIAQDLQDGTLERVLAPFVRRRSGLYLYFPEKTQAQPKLRAFIDMAKRQAK